jgi:hypothetical protein
LRPCHEVEPGRRLVVLHLAGRDETEADADARAVLKGQVKLQLLVPITTPARAPRLSRRRHVSPVQ